MSVEKFLGLKIILLRPNFSYVYSCEKNQAILLWTLLRQLPTQDYYFLGVPKNASTDF